MKKWSAFFSVSLMTLVCLVNGTGALASSEVNSVSNLENKAPGSMTDKATDLQSGSGEGFVREPPALTLTHIGPKPTAQARTIHPDIVFLDEFGETVVQSGGPLSLMKTCGLCHDTDYIARHNYHAQAGMGESSPGLNIRTGRPWDTSPGLFGKWDPLTYRLLAEQHHDRFDLGTADWVMTMGPRHVGGGPAVTSRYSGAPLTEVEQSPETHPDTHIIEPETGVAVPWDWQKSGTVELNCLLCHIQKPNNHERIAALKQGNFRWTSTATLLGTEIVTKEDNAFKWNRKMFDQTGKIKQMDLHIADPGNDNCRMCHGKACRCEDPLVFENSLDNWAVETTGEIFSASQLFHSAMNLQNKQTLNRPWDIHAERLMKCTHCHHSPNNPEYNLKERDGTKPAHLVFDARTMRINDYLLQPDHNFAKGNTIQGTVAERFSNSMRLCQDCHDPLSGHAFLPYRKLHFLKMDCRTCHIKYVPAPARRVTDWTMLTEAEKPLTEYRGIEGEINNPVSLITGFKPIVLFYHSRPGTFQLGPHNAISSWYWIGGKPEQPVRLVDLHRALFNKEGKYHQTIVTLFDDNNDGILDASELALTKTDKVELIKQQLEKIGVSSPRIVADIQQYTLGHGIASGLNATRDCLDCHSYHSLVSEQVLMAERVPGGVIPAPLSAEKKALHGELKIDAEGRLICVPGIDPKRLYLHGTSRLEWYDWLGVIIVLLSLLGIILHGSMRAIAFQRRKGMTTK